MFVGLQQTIQDLISFGLTYLQATVYITVLKLGTAKASDIARESKVNRAEVYRILNILQNSGLIEILYERPIRFIPTPPDKALSILIENIENKLKTLEMNKDEILSRLKKIQGKRGPEPIGFKVIVGRNRTYQKITEMLPKAKTEVRYATSTKGLKREYEVGIIDELIKCSKKGVKVKFITEINSTNKILSKIYRVGCEIKQLRHLPFHILILDDHQVLVGAIVKDDKLKQANANINLWLNNKEFIEIIKSSFKELWRKSNTYPRKI